MKWLFYAALTIIAYAICLTKLKAITERRKVRGAYIFWIALIFFSIFEYVFIESIVTKFYFHIVGLLLSIFYALSIYIYLKNIKKDTDSIFYKLLEQSQGRISLLTFMQATHLPPEEAQKYLNKKLKKLRGNRQTTPGNIYYEYSRWK
jgi:cellulose synthase/poly-beta-1,6-N-acetylglucosamine synthase-like glycosyltransferase